jgi:hypothetical protein
MEFNMNFWEARQAALGGENVKRLIGEDEFSRAYTPLDFQTKPMEPYEINGHWEIVEEPRQKKWTLILGPNKLDIELVYETTTGKLISAKNV